MDNDVIRGHRMRLWAGTLLLLISTTAIVWGAGRPLQPVAHPRPAPHLQLNDLQGHPHDLREYRGKVVVVNFWATWCSPCIKEMPALNRLYQNTADRGIQVLGINMGQTVKAITAFTRRVPVGFPLLVDGNMTAGPKWGVRGLPTTFVVGPGGRIVYEALGDQPWDSPALIAELEALRNGH